MFEAQKKLATQYLADAKRLIASDDKKDQEEGFFAKSFPIDIIDAKKLKFDKLPDGIGELSDSFSFSFENSGVMKDGYFYTIKTSPLYEGKQITLGDIMEEGEVAAKEVEEKMQTVYDRIGMSGCEYTFNEEW